MRCPNCASPNHKRIAGKRGMVQERDGVEFRRHLCFDCHSIFLSVQFPVDGYLAERIDDLLEVRDVLP